MNKIILSGNATKDIEIRTTQNNTEVVSGTIAVSRTFKNVDGNYDSDFINFIIFKPNDYQKGIKKGNRILIEGELRQNTYENKNKQKKVSYDVVVSRLEIFTKKETSQEQTTLEEIGVPDNYTTEYDSEVHIEPQDLPF